MLALPVLAGSAAHALGEMLSWHVGLARLPLRAKAKFLVHRSDPGTVLERGAEWRCSRARHDHHDAPDHAPGNHGPLHAAAVAAGQLPAGDRHDGCDVVAMVGSWLG
jgi:hypothetical protein